MLEVFQKETNTVKLVHFTERAFYDFVTQGIFTGFLILRIHEDKT